MISRGARVIQLYHPCDVMLLDFFCGALCKAEYVGLGVERPKCPQDGPITSFVSVGPPSTFIPPSEQPTLVRTHVSALISGMI